ncbi:MAG: WYL domain-containing protein [Clostridia bacterium]|nr:WYL domain-containing protein [Clostridia bacterium]MBO7156347.1 WYL domain-containing protein [Clostridia bacterium]
MNTDRIKRIRLMKIWELLCRESDEEHPLTTDEILTRLAEMGISSCRKTLYEDIEILNENGYEVLKTRSKSNKYYVMERAFDLPELRILMDAVQAAKFITKDKTEEFIKKIASLAGDKKAEVLRANTITFNNSKSSNKYIYYVINEIELAIEKGKKISFDYYKLGVNGEKIYQRDHKRYLVNPLATVFCDDKYYLMCYDDTHGNLVHYRVDRMEEVRMEDCPIEQTELSQTFDVKKHKEQLFGMYVGEAEEVEFIADKSIIDGLFDKFGDDLKIVEKGDKVTFSACIQTSPTFISWCMGFGDKLKISSPESVKLKIKNRLNEALNQYTEE